MILIGRGLNLRVGVAEEREAPRSGRVQRKAEAQSSVQVNSDCAVVKVRINSVRQKAKRTRMTKAEGERKLKRSGNQADKSGRQEAVTGS